MNNLIIGFKNMLNRKLYSSMLASSAVLVEWVEFTVYIYMSTVISKLFFPKESSNLQLLLTYGIFTASYFIRPVGAIAYGYIADKLGRKKVMVLSVLLMTIATFLIGCLPTYEQIGVYAPLLLLLFRLLQGFAIAIEFNNSSNYLIEQLNKTPIIASSILVAVSTGGMCLGAFIVSQMDFEAYPWAWRVPFLVSALVSFVIYILRRNITETPEFLEAKANKQLSDNPLFDVIKNHKRELVTISSLAAFIGVFLYAGHFYLITYLVKYGGYKLSVATKLAFYTELGLTVLTPAFAIIGERSGCYLNIFRAGIVMMVFTAPFLFIFALKGPEYIHLMILILVAYVIADAMFSACVFYLMYSLLPTPLRCTGTGLAYTMAIAIFGGTAPILSQGLVNLDLMYAPGVYISFIGVMTYMIARRNLGKDVTRLEKSQ
jgi:MFS transporter, MHS family, proline/betaine transporter